MLKLQPVPYPQIDRLFQKQRIALDWVRNNDNANDKNMAVRDRFEKRLNLEFGGMIERLFEDKELF